MCIWQVTVTLQGWLLEWQGPDFTGLAWFPERVQLSFNTQVRLYVQAWYPCF